MLIPVWLWSGLGWIDQAALSAGLVALTVAVGAWRRDRHAFMVQTERADLEGARRAVLEERAKIAREMHDVVAHHMSLIAVQAETAPYRLGELPEPVRAEFSELSGAAAGVAGADAQATGRAAQRAGGRAHPAATA